MTYIILNKPVGYSNEMLTELLTENNRVGKEAVLEINTLHSLNTLDTESEGLVILTNTIETRQPSTPEQEYEITIDNYLSKDAEKILKKGISLEGVFIPGIQITEEKHKGNRSVVIATMTEVTAESIRKFFKAIGYHVTAVRCIRVGEFKLGVLSIGKWKVITN